MKIFTGDDFKISSSNFNLCNPLNILRIVAGFCFFPHALSKFTADGLNTGLLAFFGKAGFTMPSPAFWLCLAAFAEVASGITLILGIATRWMALVAAGTLVIAVYALLVVGGFKWTWNTGGIEYPVVWMITCLCIALDAWKKALK